MANSEPTLFRRFTGRWCDTCLTAHPAEIRLCYGCGRRTRPANVMIESARPDGTPTQPDDTEWPEWTEWRT